jgi:hypothetical protein
MTTNDIDVIIYSYKGKLVKDVIGSLIANSSGKRKINVVLMDQHPLVREKLFADFPNLYYNHIFWDLQISPLFYKNDAVNYSKAEYILILGDNVLLNKDWDEQLIDFVDKTNCVVSGNKKVSIYQDSLFYLEKSLTDSESFSVTNFIDRDFIFFQRDKFKKFDYPTYLKYNGEEEALSLSIFASGTDIYCAPSQTLTKVGKSTIEELYVPFSINHNYNEVVELLHNGSNIFNDGSSWSRSVKDFSDFHKVDFLNINRLPFPTNDVLYDPANMNFNSVDARRFVARTKAIH